jgi:hypothetical protein
VKRQPAKAAWQTRLLRALTVGDLVADDEIRQPSAN